ncbi:glycosyl transferase family 1 [Paracoccus sulfuroxidans]|uniref:Glycosyl transferase family 1 n=1 Tax=Paracoccus sulfuroxidans TaxID=384678 RepID=A0A562NFX8_9RHOB|nr:glycosyl transferase family 1 [Paracoccus sulfuroxidans]
MVRVLIDAGGRDSAKVFERWSRRQTDRSAICLPDLWHFLDACQAHSVQAVVTTSDPRAAPMTRARGMTLIHRPASTPSRPGRHEDQFDLAHRKIADARRFSCDLVILNDEANPALYEALDAEGIGIAQILRRRPGFGGGQNRLSERLALYAARGFYASRMVALLSASDVISEDIDQLAGGTTRPIIEFLPHYQASLFMGLPPVALGASVLNICFTGPITAEMGVFDMIAAATLLRSGLKMRFHICGEGAALDAMKLQLAAAGIAGHFRFHGRVTRARLRRVLGTCQVTLVPTRSESGEGFGRSVVESVLAGRPVVASLASPAVSYAPRAVRVVEPGDVQGYVDHLAYLYYDRQELGRMAEACGPASAPFLNPANSLTSAFGRLFQAVAERRPVDARFIRVTPIAPAA